jgi:hypothetical protein
MAGVAVQQRLLADVIEPREPREHDLVAVAVGCEDLDRALDDDIGAVACLAFPEDQRRGGEPDGLSDFGERA